MRWHSTIVLVVISWGRLVVDELHRTEFVGLGEELRWLGNLIELHFSYFNNLLELLDVDLENQHAGQSCWRVFVILDII